jgi:hypothetical protein
MRVIYNGVDLLVLETHQFDWEPVYDDTGVDYLYTRVSILVRALVNGQADVVNVLGLPSQGSPAGPFTEGKVPGPFLSYDFRADAQLATPNPNFRTPQSSVPGVVPGGPGFPPNPAPTVPSGTGVAEQPRSSLREIVRRPNTPLLTHAVIRHRLTTPRGQLYVFSGPGMETGSPPPGAATPPRNARSVITLESPARTGPDPSDESYASDAKNGPLPKLFNVTAAVGDAKTLVVDWGCETFTIESGYNDVRTYGALLSNRFSQTHAVDKDGYTRLRTVGQAIFRTDTTFGTPSGTFRSPDVDRAFCMLPVPLGFVREDVVVTGLPDVTGIRYSFEDRQVSANFPSGPYAKAASINVNHRQAVVSQNNFFAAALGGYERALNLMSQRNFANMDAEKGASDIERLAEAIVKAVAVAKPGGKP